MVALQSRAVTRYILIAACATLLPGIACTTTVEKDESSNEASASKQVLAFDGDDEPETKAAEQQPARPRGKQVPPPDNVAAPPPEAKKTSSGLAYLSLEPPTGDESPSANDTVLVEYTGWTTDGVTFDTTEGSAARPLPLSRVIAGWTEGIQLMKVGEKMRFWIPQELAYKGQPGRPAGMLVFDVELQEIQKAPETPENLKEPPAEAKKTDSGLAYLMLEKGQSNERPREWDRVKVNFTGWSSDGKMIASSTTRGGPAQFELNRVMPGWAEGIQLMTKGEKARFWIPEELATQGRPGAPQGMLVFDFELLEIEKRPEPPPAPKDVAEPPADAKKTDSGLAYKVLEKGKGSDHPTADSKVTVHYSGWTTDGKMFDSSVTRGKPSTFPLKGVIPGWTEGVQLMVPGEKTRFWIPEELAYKGRPGKPQGMLVFDIELIEIQ